MKPGRLLLLTLGLAVVLFTLLPNLAWAADDSTNVFKAKCAVCHGVDGAGKPAMKIPSLVSDDAKKMTDAYLTDAIANGGKSKKPMHTFSAKGLAPDQIKMLVAYIRTLQK